jgi:transcription elongation factor GreA
MASTTFLTQDGYQKLLEELRMLKEERLPETLQRLKEAIGQWDISENAEYDTAMSEKDLIEARISEIERSLDDVQIIESSTGSEIKYGSKVSFKEEGKEDLYSYTIVGSWEMNILEGTISFDSPLGIAMRGKRKGDVVQVRAPNKRYNVTIVSVE